MDRDTPPKLWDDWREGDIWIAPWKAALDGLTAEQAAWPPSVGAWVGGPSRHSIWQNVTHILMWRNVTFDMLAGRPRPSTRQLEAGNFAAPAEVTEAAWTLTRDALADSHRRLRAAIADPATPLEPPRYHLPHVAHHLG